jgi:4-azaleucine resistance transporter AzlC
MDAVGFRRGAVAMLPLWTGVAPFGFTFALLARTGGFSPIETQALSMLVFAGSAQVAAVTLAAGGAGAAGIVLTTLLLNLRHVLYGLSLALHLPSRTRPPKPVLAFFLTDESFGLTLAALRDGRGGDGYLFGASLSLYACFAVATLAGTLLGAALPDPRAAGLDFVFTLSFLVLLMPLLRSRHAWAMAVASATLSLLLSAWLDGGIVVLVATVCVAGAGAALGREEHRP